MTLPELLAKLDELRAAVTALMDDQPVLPTAPTDAPFGVGLDGKPKFAPAWDACHAMRDAAAREGVANFSALIGGGIRPGAAQMYDGFQPNLQLIEDTILALGHSPWGRAWLAHDENAALISRAYCRTFVGYHVERVHQNDQSQGFRRVP